MNDGPSLSTLEELDADPAVESSSRLAVVRRREIVLGVLLVLAALCWAGLQGWQQENARSHYHLAEQALIADDWDTALSNFAAAASINYRDARARADEARKKVTERDKQYEAARASIAKGDWLLALQSAQAVNSIQPGYKDVSSLDSQARKHVYDDALDGVLAMRDVANPPGLYYYSSPAGWTWLQGSDKWSAIQSFDFGPSEGAARVLYIVFDVPGPDWTVPPPSASDASGAGGLHDLAGRRLVAATLGKGVPVLHPLAFDPTGYSYYISGSGGVWATRTNFDTATPEAALRYVYTGGNLDYQAFDSPVTSTVALKSPDSLIVGVDRQGAHLLIAEWDPLSPGERGDVLHLRVFLANATGEIEKPLYSLYGGLVAVQLSPDGRYALLRTYALLASAPVQQKQDLVLLDVKGSIAPRVLDTSRSDADITTDRWLSSGSTFISRGKFAGMVLLDDWSSGKNLVRMVDPSRFDPAHPDEASTLKATLDVSTPLVWVDAPGDGKSLLLTGVSNFDGLSETYQGAQTNTVSTALLSPDAPPRVSHFTVDGTINVVAMPSRDTSALYRIQDLRGLKAGYETSFPYDLQSLPLGSLGAAHVVPTSTYTTDFGSRSSGQGSSLRGSSWFSGPKLLAYVQDGIIRARSYEDPKLDVPLDSDNRASSFYGLIGMADMDLLH